MKNPLLDKDFLKKLDLSRNKIIYAKIISLAMDESPREEITGKVTSGSINIDGASAVRRTCSISLVANDVNLNSFYWGLNTKFKVFIGVENLIDSNYPNIIWFPQGIYLITSFSSSQSINSYNINIQGKDKMCLLNGEIGGTFSNISTVLHEMDIATNVTVGNRIETIINTEKLTLKKIIYKVVTELGGEKISNIIINDLDDYGLELMKYSSLSPMYLFLDQNNEPYQITLNGNQGVVFKGKQYKIKNLLKNENFKQNTLLENFSSEFSEVTLGREKCTVAEIIDNQTVGYRLTDITFAGELVANAGETVTTVLDKIKNQLGDFEYFYDVEGRFVFQRAKNFVNVSWNSIVTQTSGELEYVSTKDQYVLPNVEASPFTYNFEGNFLVNSLSNNPVINNIKNDFTVWGTRKSVLGNELPIHMRFALDKKPTKYVSLEIQDSDPRLVAYNKKYNASIKGQKSVEYNIKKYDWRELIYQMAKDYRKYNHIDDFNALIAEKNPEFIGGITGYEDYYTDMEGFWRQIYNPKPSADKKNEYYPSTAGKLAYWHINAVEDPGSLNFWIDFMDTDGEIMKYSVPAIGRRKKVVNDKDVTSLYFKSVPTIIFYDDDSDRNKKSGYTYFKINESIEKYFDLSSQKKSAAEEIDRLFYQNIYAQESISISTIPIYYLEPNVSIYVKDDKNLNINGQYSITKLSIPLQHNGMMSISATKVVKKGE